MYEFIYVIMLTTRNRLMYEFIKRSMRLSRLAAATPWGAYDYPARGTPRSSPSKRLFGQSSIVLVDSLVQSCEILLARDSKQPDTCL